jgi:hypothetical protein
MTKTDYVALHQKQLDEFKLTGSRRNDALNKHAFVSFGYAMANDSDLNMSKVEDDYRDAAIALGLDKSGIKATINSALRSATPFTVNGSSNGHSNAAKPVSKESLKLAPVYTALEDYAIAHGVPVEAFTKAGWTIGWHNKRRGLFVPHEDGITRIRFLDDNGAKWMPIKPQDMQGKVTPCWYGFKPAIQMAKDSTHKTIVLTNGQPSVIAAHYYNVPALATTDGEGKKLEKGPLLKRLLDAIKEHELKIIIAMDGDDAGRKATEQRKDALLANGIQPRVVLFGGDDGFDLADYCKQHKSQSMDKLVKLSAYSVRVNEPVLSRQQLAKQAEGQLVAPAIHVPPGQIVVTPFKSLHQYGGLAYLLQPGKMTMVLAPSGGGKTSWMETWQDILNQRGIDTLFFSPEWSPLELQHRTIQRYSKVGVTTQDIELHLLYEQEKQYGIPSEQRIGKELKNSSPKYNDWFNTNRWSAKWPGTAYAFQGQKATGEILEAMSKKLYELRRSDRRVGVAFFDYVQIMKPDYTEDDVSRYESICGDVKQWCADNWIHPVVGSQPTKTVGNASRKGDKILDEYDSHWVRPDSFNFIATLNIKEVEKFEAGLGTGEMIKEPFGTINICKNSKGREGQVKINTNFKHLAWSG